MNNSCAVAPLTLDHAVEHQRSQHPADDAVLNRLLAYLRTQRPTMREIKDAVCDFYFIAETALMSHSRKIENVKARQVFCFLAYRYTRASLYAVGIAAGGLDHTTVRHSCLKIQACIRNQPRLDAEIVLLEERMTEKVLLRSQGRF